MMADSAAPGRDFPIQSRLLLERSRRHLRCRLCGQVQRGEHKGPASEPNGARRHEREFHSDGHRRGPAGLPMAGQRHQPGHPGCHSNVHECPITHAGNYVVVVTNSFRAETSSVLTPPRWSSGSFQTPNSRPLCTPPFPGRTVHALTAWIWQRWAASGPVTTGLPICPAWNSPRT